MVLEPLARRGWPGDRNEGSCGGVTCCPSAFLPKAAPGCCLMARPWEAGLCSLGGTRAPGTGCEAGSSVPSEAAVGPGQAEDWPSTCADDGCERRGLGRDLPGVPQATWLTASRLPFKGLGSAGRGQMLWGAPVSLPGFCALVPGHPSPGLLSLTSPGPQTLTGLTGSLGRAPDTLGHAQPPPLPSPDRLFTCSSVLSTSSATAAATSGSPWPSRAPYPLDPSRHRSAGSAGPGHEVPRGGQYHTLGLACPPGHFQGRAALVKATHTWTVKAWVLGRQPTLPGVCAGPRGEAQRLSPSPGCRGPQQERLCNPAWCLSTACAVLVAAWGGQAWMKGGCWGLPPAGTSPPH